MIRVSVFVCALTALTALVSFQGHVDTDVRSIHYGHDHDRTLVDCACTIKRNSDVAFEVYRKGREVRSENCRRCDVLPTKMPAPSKWGYFLSARSFSLKLWMRRSWVCPFVSICSLLKLTNFQSCSSPASDHQRRNSMQHMAIKTCLALIARYP
jgi:hypothetical protein